MTQKEKLFKEFLKNPCSLRYVKIEKILLSLGFEKIEAKGSHKKFKHPLLEKDLIIPVHGNECKDFYKKFIQKTLKQYIL